MEAADSLEATAWPRGWCRCRAWTPSPSRTSPTATRSCRRPAGRGWPSRRRARSAGIAGSAREGAFIGMTTFGESGPYKDVYEHFGITPEKIAEAGRTATRASRGGAGLREEITMSIGAPVNERLASAHRGGNERLARPDPPQPDHRAASSSSWSRSTRCAAMTSNPAIFEKAILGSDDYDERAARAVRRGPGRARDLRARSRSRTCSWPPTCCGRSGTRPTAPTASCRSRCRPRWPTTPRPRSRRRARSGSASTART